MSIFFENPTLNAIISQLTNFMVKNKHVLNNKNLLVINFIDGLEGWDKAIIPYPIYVRKKRKKEESEKIIKLKKKKFDLEKKIKDTERKLEIETKIMDDEIKSVDLKEDEIYIPVDLKKADQLRMKETEIRGKDDLMMEIHSSENEINRLREDVRSMEKKNKDLMTEMTDLKEFNEYLLENDTDRLLGSDDESSKKIVETRKIVVSENKENIEEKPKKNDASSQTNDKTQEIIDKAAKETGLPILDLHDIIRKYYLNESRFSNLYLRVRSIVPKTSDNIANRFIQLEANKGRSFALDYFIACMVEVDVKLREMISNGLIKI